LAILAKDVESSKNIHCISARLRSILNYNKAKDVLGWMPEVSLEEGLEITYKWFKKNYFKF
jgi:nucleoside-diphosphate-sugar epimerase